MNLFEHTHEKQICKEAPLADRMRPRELDEFVGQNHILAPGRLLRRAIQADQLSSLIFYGPPGTGKQRSLELLQIQLEQNFFQSMQFWQELLIFATASKQQEKFVPNNSGVLCCL